MPHPIELVLPDEPVPVRLMNTVWADRRGRHDALADADDLHTFLVETGLAAVDTGPPTTGQVDSACRLRDALRRLAGSVTGDDRPLAAMDIEETDAVNAVNAAIARAPNRHLLTRTDRGWTLGPADDPSVDAALGRIAREGVELIADPTGPLRACRAPGCVLYFVRDHPRREWCGISCGNRVRAARHYRRLRATGG